MKVRKTAVGRQLAEVICSWLNLSVCEKPRFFFTITQETLWVLPGEGGLAPVSEDAQAANRSGMVGVGEGSLSKNSECE